MGEGIKYRTGVYLRLSREDRETQREGLPDRSESDSIRSQRELCLSWISGHAELELFEIYTDDGCSGATFTRPAFGRLMEDVAAGLVNCILVKDECVILELNAESP